MFAKLLIIFAQGPTFSQQQAARSVIKNTKNPLSKFSMQTEILKYKRKK